MRKSLDRHLLATVAMSSASLFGKALAVIKTMMIASTFGASGEMDAFWVAFLIPNLLPAFARSAFITSFVPFYLRAVREVREVDLWRAASQVFSVGIALSVVVSAIVFLWPDQAVRGFAPGLGDDVSRTAARLLSYTSFSVFLIVFTSMLTSVSHCRQDFTPSALEPITTNGVVVVGLLWFGAKLSIDHLAGLTVAGFMLQMTVMVYACRQDLAMNLRLQLPRRSLLAKDYVKGLVPVLIGTTSGVGMGLLNQYLLSFIPQGGISIVQYASMMAMLPVEIFVASIQSAYFPEMAKLSMDTHAAASLHRKVMRIIVFVMLPITALMMSASDLLSVFVYGQGRASNAVLNDTSNVLSIMAVGMVLRSIAYFNFQVLHAFGKPWLQVRLGFLQMALSFMLGLALLHRFGIAGIAIGGTLAFAVTAAASYAEMIRRMGRGVVSQLPGFFAIGSIAALAAAAAVLIIKRLPIFLSWADGGRLAQVSLLSIYGLLGVAVFFVIAKLLKLREADMAWALLLRRAKS